jgi:hypothetical protein
MHPLCFEEFLLASYEESAYDFLMNYTLGMDIPDIIHSKLWELLKIYFVTGGLPEAVKTYTEKKDNLFNALSKVRETQNNLILTYYADIAKHSGKINSMQIERLWRNIPNQLAREQNGSSKRFKFTGVIPGKKGYLRLSGIIDWLNTAGLIIKTQITKSGNLPFSAFTDDNLFKLYIFDIGILGAISRLEPKTILDYDYGTYKGYFAENFVAQEFLCSFILDKDLYSWKKRTAEVEFLKQVNGRVIPIEVKSGFVTQAKSIKVFAQKYNPDYRVIFSANNLKIDNVKKIHKYPLYLAYKFPLK